MSTVWKDVTGTIASADRVLTMDEHEATEDVLAAAEEWDAGRLPFTEALAVGGGMNPHRARGLAFRFRRDDARLPALEALSVRMSAQFRVVLEDGTMVDPTVWYESENNIATWQRNREGATT